MSGGEEAGAVTLVDRILSRAVHEGASDVHIEPRADEVRVRFRIDGVLVERSPFPEGFRASVASRLKIMANLDIAERRLPQDGAFRLAVGEREVDIRLSTFPTEYGEKVVLRLLRSDREGAMLDALGMPGMVAAQLKAFAQRSFGMLLVCGPTGSGKTSTLYGVLREIDARARNIVTLEDPIEYRFDDITQAQTNPRIGFTFARGLRSMLRQDPDVIMVGEMRDAETAEIAFKAALTGHLVLSSLHTASAIETFVRLFDMGLERYVVASALKGMLGQRLVRRLCPQCKRPMALSPELRRLIGVDGDQPVSVFAPMGCTACNHTGYRGRTGVFELIEADDELTDFVKDESITRVALREFLENRGYRGLRTAAFDLVQRGVTSIEEVMRVT
ncbi:MAG: type II/IV secretion system protein [Myxococcales bacterium]|nr:type II/IV secretion system protein [Myxococcales bacterium]